LRWWDKLRGRPPQPVLLNAKDFPEGSIGVGEWNPVTSSDLLSFSDDRRTVWWDEDWRERTNSPYVPAWLGSLTRLRLHSGRFAWDFVVEEIAAAQMGVGVMLVWDIGPDWGFFGYLGSSPTGWAYDPSTGDVVCNTESISGGLGTFGGETSGIVSVELNVPREADGHVRFQVGGISSPEIPLPPGCVVQPAASLLRPTQRVRLDRFRVF
jgi:hypothetical protein